MHLASLPMNDLDENAAMVNAVQRRADVIVQKSIAEGFGLTVAEGMWKEKPVVGIDRFLAVNRLAEYVELVGSLMTRPQTTASRKAPTA